MKEVCQALPVEPVLRVVSKNVHDCACLCLSVVLPGKAILVFKTSCLGEKVKLYKNINLTGAVSILAPLGNVLGQGLSS